MKRINTELRYVADDGTEVYVSLKKELVDCECEIGYVNTLGRLLGYLKPEEAFVVAEPVNEF